MRYLVLLLLGSCWLLTARRGGADDPSTNGYFPLRVGNWWTYEEQDEGGIALSRETWTLVPDAGDNRVGEFHLRSVTKRLDALGHLGNRWEGDEYLRVATDGVRKRFPAGRDAELELVLLKEPARFGTRWRDAQGSCEVTVEHGTCVGPHGDLEDCVVTVCSLGEPPATTVTSTYARGVGMVRQEVDVIQMVPGLDAAAGVMVPMASAKGGHSVLRLRAYNIGRAPDVRDARPALSPRTRAQEP
jgi:hypothetical protein